jgi:chromate transporter
MWGVTPAVDGLLYGLRPAVLALIFMAARRIGGKAMRAPWQKVLAAASLVLSWAGLPFPAILTVAAIVGCSVRSEAPTESNEPGSGAASRVGRRIAWGGLVFVLLWVGLFAASSRVIARGTDLALFFTKSAFVTFGGAYAVLPYVFDASVHQYGWLQPAQVIDGLALGEATPGPLIMVVTFIGFLAGWGDPGALASPFLHGLAGAGIATAFTFLPSLALILMFAPLVSRAQATPWIRQALAGITAAVVAVILRLGLNLSATVLLLPRTMTPDAFACLLVAGSVFALNRNASAPLVIGATAALGALLRFLGA